MGAAADGSTMWARKKGPNEAAVSGVCRSNSGRRSSWSSNTARRTDTEATWDDRRQRKTDSGAAEDDERGPSLTAMKASSNGLPCRAGAVEVDGEGLPPSQPSSPPSCDALLGCRRSS